MWPFEVGFIYSAVPLKLFWGACILSLFILAAESVLWMRHSLTMFELLDSPELHLYFMKRRLLSLLSFKEKGLKEKSLSLYSPQMAFSNSKNLTTL
jgi:hypothetical protein